MSTNTQYDDDDLARSSESNWEKELPEEVEAERAAKERGELEFGDRESTESSGLWYPDADDSVSMHVKGNYAGGYPVGAVVHFTAGRRERGDLDAVGTMKYGRTNRHLYFCISSTGKVYQPAPMNKWGSHCGESSYPGLGSSLSSKLVGIEVCAAGKLHKKGEVFEPDWNKHYSANDPRRTIYKADEVRFIEGSDKPDRRIHEGHYLKYTPQQEESLVKLLVWMHKTKPDVFEIKNIVGHDEISFNRKNDPGGSMSWIMKDLRELVGARIA